MHTSQRVITIVKKGGVGVIPTDTILGIVGSALSRQTVARIYRLRKRNPKKPMIVLISHMRDLSFFGIRLGPRKKYILSKVWPGPVSVIFPCPRKRFTYLHRGTKTLALRLPGPVWLRRLLAKTGPLVAPSANWESKPPAKNMREARRYFGNHVDFYVAGQKRIAGTPSALIAFRRDAVTVLRHNAFLDNINLYGNGKFGKQTGKKSGSRTAS